MVTGLIPVVGVPLPLISYGGTAMLTVLLGFGLMLERRRPPRHHDPAFPSTPTARNLRLGAVCRQPCG